MIKQSRIANLQHEDSLQHEDKKTHGRNYSLENINYWRILGE